MKKYSIIYADPAWSYGDKMKGFGGATDHYKTMTKEKNIAKNQTKLGKE